MSGLTFLSWTRLGTPLDGVGEDPLAGALPARAEVSFGVTLNQLPEIVVPGRVLGPGDVTGLDPAQLLRAAPEPGPDVEPTFFPLVEFDRPDLPWLLTPARARAGERLRPWIVLVVVDVDASTLGPEQGALLPVLRCPADELPDLRESWAWAHAQVVTDGDLTPGALDALLTGVPERALSRLLCPRLLEAGHRYRACVVPAFAAGARAGLGEEPAPEDAATVRPAWDPDTPGEVRLPAYHHWEFGVGPEGDFLSLVRRLRARTLPDSVGSRPVDVARPGAGLPTLEPEDPAAVLGFDGALRGPFAPPPTWGDAAAAAFAGALAPLLTERPGRFGPPLHGAGPSGSPSVAGGPAWLAELNLDPRRRAAAGHGAAVVRRQQEALMTAAWRQAAGVLRVNDALRRAALAREAATRVHGRLPADDAALLRLVRPAGVTPLPPGATELRGALSVPFRRLTRPGSVLVRRAGSADAAAALVAARELTVNPPLAPAPGPVTLERLTAGADSVARLDASRVGEPRWAVTPSGPIGDVAPAPPRALHVGAAMPDRIFVVTEDGRLFSRLDAPVAWHDHGAPPGGVAVDQPSGLADRAVFVRTADGRVCSLAWDGDRWGWRDHGRPGGHDVRFRPLALQRSSRPTGGEVAELGTFAGVYVCAGGSLWELDEQQGGRWFWLDRGRPAGTTVEGAVGGQEWLLGVYGADGGVRLAHRVGAGWNWLEFGVPGPLVLEAPPAMSTGGQPIVPLADGRLRVPFLFGDWNDLPAPESVRRRLDGRWFWVEGASGAVMGLHGSTWETHPAPPAAGWGTVRANDEPWVARDGALWALRAGPPRQWESLGLPTEGGAGDPAGPPPVNTPAWRGIPGYMANVVVVTADARDGAGTVRAAVGRDTGFEGEVRDGWSALPPSTPAVPAPTLCSAVTLADLDPGPDAAQQLVHLRVENRGPQGNVGVWRIGRVGADGAVTWGADAGRTPTPMSTTYGSSGAIEHRADVPACAVAVGDLDGDGAPELVVAYVSGLAFGRVFYRIGWHLQPDGTLAGGWTESTEVPWPDRPGGGPPARASSLSVALTDLDGDLRPELVVGMLEEVAGLPRLRYLVGTGINARGRVVGGWDAAAHDVGGAPLPGDLRGAALAFADFSGSHAPDLVVALLAGDPAAPRLTVRVGFDVQPDTRRARDERWSEDRDAPGTAPGPAIAGVALGDLHGDLPLAVARRAYTGAFRAAATAHQAAVVDRGQRLALVADEPAVDPVTAAAQARAALRPDDRVPERVTERLTGLDLGALPAGADPLAPVAVAPVFTEAMAAPLVELDRDLLMPGVAGVPADTMTVARANPTFIEAYLVGAGHELAREMRWRGFPLDRRATFFRRFWDTRGAEAPDDVPPIAAWGGGLGTHAVGIGGPDTVVLLVRGDLLRRYPDARVFARRAAWGEVEPLPRQLAPEVRAPRFRMAVPPDIVLFGFALTVREARGDEFDPGWFFVLGEHPAAPRFGIPDAPAGAPAEVPDAWEDLHRGVLPATARHVPLDGALAGVSRPDHIAGVSFTWARNAAQMAHIVMRRPVEVAVHASDMLDEVPDGRQVTGVVLVDDPRPELRVRAVVGRWPDGRPWRLSVAEAIETVRRREALFVLDQTVDPQGFRYDVLPARTDDGVAYLRTTGDVEGAPILLTLPELVDA